MHELCAHCRGTAFWFALFFSCVFLFTLMTSHSTPYSTPRKSNLRQVLAQQITVRRTAPDIPPATPCVTLHRVVVPECSGSGRSLDRSTPRRAEKRPSPEEFFRRPGLQPRHSSCQRGLQPLKKTFSCHVVYFRCLREPTLPGGPPLVCKGGCFFLLQPTYSPCPLCSDLCELCVKAFISRRCPCHHHPLVDTSPTHSNVNPNIIYLTRYHLPAILLRD